ncbi:uncharacterized protein [Malus domestica]|uniref:uncharacterized protein n=1 Tax=Malus domestica TaxID=3750 RepID=UPI003974DFBC
MKQDEDDDHRRQRASHSHRVMKVVDQIAKLRRANATSLIPEQKITTALRMLAYGASADQVDEIARMGKTTVLESLMRFCSAIEAFYTNEYLRAPTPIDMRRLLRNGEIQGFRGIIGSIECMYWTWKNCPRAQNDLNVFVQSLVFDELLSAARMFDVEALRSIMMTCIILHNMSMENEALRSVDEYEPDLMNNSRTRIYYAHDRTEDHVQHEPLEWDGRYNELIVQRYTSVQEPYWHVTGQNDLIEHQWGLQEGEDN